MASLEIDEAMVDTSIGTPYPPLQTKLEHEQQPEPQPEQSKPRPDKSNPSTSSTSDSPSANRIAIANQIGNETIANREIGEEMD